MARKLSHRRLPVTPDALRAVQPGAHAQHWPAGLPNPLPLPAQLHPLKLAWQLRAATSLAGRAALVLHLMLSQVHASPGDPTMASCSALPQSKSHASSSSIN